MLSNLGTGPYKLWKWVQRIRKLVSSDANFFTPVNFEKYFTPYIFYKNTAGKFSYGHAVLSLKFAKSSFCFFFFFFFSFYFKPFNSTYWPQHFCYIHCEDRSNGESLQGIAKGMNHFPSFPVLSTLYSESNSRKWECDWPILGHVLTAWPGEYRGILIESPTKTSGNGRKEN